MSKGTRETRPEYMTDRVYTYEDYLQLPEEEGYHYEILDGMLIREPTPYVHRGPARHNLHS